MLNGTLALHDIRDTEAFVAAIVKRSHLNLNTHDQEDLTAYLLATCWELSTRQPQQWRTSFSGWATPLLQLRIVDWQRQRHGRTTWKFKDSTHERERPQHLPLDDHLGDLESPPHRDPHGDRNASDLVRLLRTRSSDEAWRHHQRRPSLPSRAA